MKSNYIYTQSMRDIKCDMTNKDNLDFINKDFERNPELELI